MADFSGPDFTLNVLVISSNGETSALGDRRGRNYVFCVNLNVRPERGDHIPVLIYEKSLLPGGAVTETKIKIPRNAVVLLVGDRRVVVANEYTESYIFVFVNAGTCLNFYYHVRSFLHFNAVNDALETLRLDFQRHGCREPFVEEAKRLLSSTNRHTGVLELHAGLGIFTHNILLGTDCPLISVTNRSLVPHLMSAFRDTHRNRHTVLADTNEDLTLACQPDAVVSSRLQYFLFDTSILRKFLDARNYCSDMLPVPTELIIECALIESEALHKQKLESANFWKNLRSDVDFSALVEPALWEAFNIPVVGTNEEFTIVAGPPDGHSLCGTAFDLGSVDLDSVDVEVIETEIGYKGTQTATVHGMLIWCKTVVNGNIVNYGFGDSPSPSSVACLVQRPFAINAGTEIDVVCTFKLNHGGSYDIQLEYTAPKAFPGTKISRHSLMLAEPHPFGKTIRRERELRRN